MEGEWEKPSFMSPDEVKVLQEVAAQEDFKGKITVETNPDPTKYPPGQEGSGRKTFSRSSWQFRRARNAKVLYGIF